MLNSQQKTIRLWFTRDKIYDACHKCIDWTNTTTLLFNRLPNSKSERKNWEKFPTKHILAFRHKFFGLSCLRCLSSFVTWFLCIQEKEQSALRAHSSSIRGSNRQSKISEPSVAKTEKSQPFIKEEVVSEIYNVLLVLLFQIFSCIVLQDAHLFYIFLSLYRLAGCFSVHCRAIFQAFVRWWFNLYKWVP